MGTKLLFQPPPCGPTELQSTARLYAPSFQTRPDHVIVYSHGNAEDLRITGKFCQEMANVTGWLVCTYDYTGYGATQGIVKPSVAQTHRDIRRVCAAVRKVLQVPWSRMVLMGFSLGSGPSCALAAAGPDLAELAGLVIVGGFTSAAEVVPVLAWLRGVSPYRNLQCLRRVTCPVLVMHGTHDEIIPWAHGQALAAEAAKRTRVTTCWMQGQGHNTVFTAQAWKTLNMFLNPSTIS